MPAVASKLTLEDRVFGLDDEPPPPPGPHPARDASNPDSVSRIMMPLVVVCVILGVSLWSLAKSTQYAEFFTGNPRYRYVLYGLNAAVVLIAVLLLMWYNGRTPPKEPTLTSAP